MGVTPPIEVPVQEEEDRQANPNVEIEEDPWKADVDLPVPLAPDEDHSDLEEELLEDPVSDPPVGNDFDEEDLDLPVPLHEPDLAPDEDHSDLEEELFEDPLE